MMVVGETSYLFYPQDRVGVARHDSFACVLLSLAFATSANEGSCAKHPLDPVEKVFVVEIVHSLAEPEALLFTAVAVMHKDSRRP